MVAVKILIFLGVKESKASENHKMGIDQVNKEIFIILYVQRGKEQGEEDFYLGLGLSLKKKGIFLNEYGIIC
jgi:hypothetical protein